MLYVKLCGIRTIEHALVAAEAGASMIGFMFAPSKRQVAPEAVAEITAVVRAQVATPPQFVGVFVNETPAQIAAVIEQCGLDAVQLSGDENVAVLAELPDIPVIKALRLTGDERESRWLDTPPEAVTVLVDAHVAGSYGGTGSTADWTKAAALARTRPVLLAGGLTTENVRDAVAQVRPWGVDVSSGIETDGQKDPLLMRRFVQLVQTAPR